MTVGLQDRYACVFLLSKYSFPDEAMYGYPTGINAGGLRHAFFYAFAKNHLSAR